MLPNEYKGIVRFVLLLGAFLSGLCACAQILPDSVVRQSALTALVNRYDQAVGEHSRLYNGPEYIDLYANKILKGHPYYRTDEPLRASIVYDGQKYNSVILRYNLFQKVLVVEHPRSHREIELIQDQVNSFQIENRIFVRLTEPDRTFYAVLYKGSLKIYAQYYKTIQESMDAKSKTTEFLLKTNFFIKKGHQFHEVSSKASVLSVLAERKTELRKFLKQEKISYRANKEYALQRIGAYYDQLNHSDE